MVNTITSCYLRVPRFLFSLDITPLQGTLLLLLFACAIVGATIGLRNMRAFARHGRRIDTTYDGNYENLPPVSVIVYAKNAERYIREYLRTLLSQDYPDFEVIVVDDASIDNTAGIVDSLKEQEPRLRSSFVPDSSRNVSRPKAALTIGAKAARNPVIVITRANSVIPSPGWLKQLASPMASPYIKITLAASSYPWQRQQGAGKWYRSFDSLSVLSQWMGSAMAGHPYRGDAYCLAFRRDDFFATSGFASTNRFVAGEDDIFVNERATRHNTAVAFAPDAMLERVLPTEEYPRLWLREKERYAFTGRYLHTDALRRQGLLSICQWGSLLSTIATWLTAWPNLLPCLAASALLLLLWGYEICLYRRAASLAGQPRLFWAVPLFWLVRPIAGALMRVRFRADKASNYTWQHQK